ALMVVSPVQSFAEFEIVMPLDVGADVLPNSRGKLPVILPVIMPLFARLLLPEMRDADCNVTTPESCTGLFAPFARMRNAPNPSPPNDPLRNTLLVIIVVVGVP